MLSDVAKSIGFVGLQKSKFTNHTSEYRFVTFCTFFIRFAAAVSNVLPLLVKLSQDPEPVVRQHLVEQLKALAKVCVNSMLSYMTDFFGI